MVTVTVPDAVEPEVKVPLSASVELVKVNAPLEIASGVATDVQPVAVQPLPCMVKSIRSVRITLSLLTVNAIGNDWLVVPLQEPW